MKKILVPVKRVPDYEMKVKIASDSSNIETSGIKWIVNPFDEIAVEEAIKVKEASDDIEVVIVSIGSADTVEQMRSALAMGADRGILVVTDDYVDSDVASLVLESIYKKDDYSLIIMGKQSIDSDANQTGQLLASRLGLAQGTFASKLTISDNWNTAEVVREVDGGLETITISLPGIVTTDLRLNEPRYPSLPGIVKAKKKPLEEIPIADLGLDTSPKVKVVSMEYPAERSAGVKVDTVETLVEKLQNEAKVI